jgi:DNA-directed RNA polymerase specialized sigma subunit
MDMNRKIANEKTEEFLNQFTKIMESLTERERDLMKLAYREGLITGYFYKMYELED